MKRKIKIINFFLFKILLNYKPTLKLKKTPKLKF